MQSTLQDAIEKAVKDFVFDYQGVYFNGVDRVFKIEEEDGSYIVYAFATGIEYGYKTAEDSWKQYEVEAEVAFKVSVEGEEVVNVEVDSVNLYGEVL